jgi:microcin C transport system permease protein
MFVYLIRRLLLAIPTFLGITLVTFFIINAAPGGPIEQKLQKLRMGGGGDGGKSTQVSQEILDGLVKQYGFDKPIHERYFIWLKNISRLDFGESFAYQEPVIDIISILAILTYTGNIIIYYQFNLY